MIQDLGGGVNGIIACNITIEIHLSLLKFWGLLMLQLNALERPDYSSRDPPVPRVHLGSGQG